jgi:hypothetical protein
MTRAPRKLVCVLGAYRNLMGCNVITDTAYFAGNPPYSIRPYSSHVAGGGRGPRSPQPSVCGPYTLCSLGGWPIGAAFPGWPADVAGPRTPLLVGGAITLLATLIACVGARDVLWKAREA